MPPQKRSIRDFFAPAPKASQAAPERQIPDAAPASRATPAESNDTVKSDGIPRRSAPSPNNPFAPTDPAMNTVGHPTLQSTVTETRSFHASQSSANSTFTSKRIVSNGEPMVLNSDTDTDSDESLPDLQWPVAKPSPAAAPVIKAMSWDVSKDNELRKPPARKKDNVAFSAFVQKTQKSAEAERQIAEAKAGLEKPVVVETPATDHEISEQMLADAVRNGDDPEKARRLYLAMQRVNALQMDCVFHLFREDCAAFSSKDSQFPMQSLPDQEWSSCFQDRFTRDQAFISGFAKQAFLFQQLPEELVSWMIDQVCANGNGLLNDRYLELLEAHHQHLPALLTTRRLDSMFTSLGADSKCLDPQHKVTPSFEPELTPKRPLPPSLEPICRLLQTAAPWLHDETRSRALWILFHVCMDDSVCSNIDILHHVQDAIEAIMRSVPDNNRLASMLNKTISPLLTRITHPILQLSLVTSLPASSPLSAYLQRQLSLSFLLHPTPITVPLESPQIPRLICTYLQTSPRLRVTRKTDYVSLEAYITLLDIAIGPGPLSVPYQPLLSPPPSQLDDTPFAPAKRLTAEEKEFNKAVDDIAHGLEAVSDSIMESGGMVDLTRMQAKDCCERLYYRLQNSVRIGGRKKVNVLGDDGEVQFDTGVFKRFLKTGRVQAKDGQEKTSVEVGGK